MEKYSETQMRHALKPNEIVIEIDNEHVDVKERYEVTELSDLTNPDKMKIVKQEVVCGNRNQSFSPVDMRSSFGRQMNAIRTRRVLMRDGEDARFNMHKALRQVDFIPGERIHIDLEAKRGRITDAIFDPENDELYSKFQRIGREIYGNSVPFIPGEPVDMDLSDPFALWGWAFHMAKIMLGDGEHNSGDPPWRGCSVKGPRLCRPVQNVHKMPTLEEIIRTCKVRLPYTPYQKAEQEKEWIERRKSEDPDYVRQDGNQIIYTPWLAGFGQSKQELATAAKE